MLLLAGALCVWFRGASREMEVVEDELDVGDPLGVGELDAAISAEARRTDYATVVPYISSNGSEMSSSRSPSGPEK